MDKHERMCIHDKDLIRKVLFICPDCALTDGEIKLVDEKNKIKQILSMAKDIYSKIWKLNEIQKIIGDDDKESSINSFIERVPKEAEYLDIKRQFKRSE